MLIASLFSWWYGVGLKRRATDLLDSLFRTVDFFSIWLLIKTLFAPFRQIEAGKLAKAPLDVQVKMFFGRLVSRFVGAGARLVLMVAGIVVITLQTILSFLMVVIHIGLPLLPVFGLVMAMIGWVPTWPF